MREFFDVLSINFKKIILPIIVLACGTVVLQMIVYGVTLRDNYGYRFYEFVDPVEDSVICEVPIPFMSVKSIECWDNICLASLMVAVALIIIFGMVKDNSVSILRNLPVRRSTLWIAKFTQVSLTILFVLSTNYCSMYLQYLYYENTIHEKFRTLFAFGWGNGMLSDFVFKLVFYMFVATIITIVHCVKNYSVKVTKLRKGGYRDETK